jgi:hypothetical protein
MSIKGLCAGQYDTAVDADTGAQYKLVPQVKEFKEFKSGAQKDVAGKLRMDLIPPETDKSYAEVLTLGASKYSDRNWEKGVPYMTCIASLKRHLNDFELGEDINVKDGNLYHVQHMQFWVNALVTFSLRNRTDLDDRPSKKADDESNKE